MHRDPYEPAARPFVRAPERPPEPADWFRAEYNEGWRGRGYTAAPREPVGYQPCRYIDGRHVMRGYACPHQPEELDDDVIEEVD